MKTLFLLLTLVILIVLFMLCILAFLVAGYLSVRDHLNNKPK